MPRVAEVFVAGGQPRVTYVPRSALELEDKVREYLDTKHKVLSISGPTKTGKTVLVRSVIPRDHAFWISGGQLENSEELWERILEQGGGFTEITESDNDTSAEERGREFDASAKVFDFGGGAKSVYKEQTQKSTGKARTRNVSPQVAAVSVLMESGKPLIIDDFHYLPQDVQLRIVRSLKEPVFDGLPVIFLAVPHRAYDTVRVEREMTGRVAQVEIPFWSTEELKEIARKGFQALKLSVPADVIERLAMEAFSSPHLMQDFCGALCRANGIAQTQEEVTPLDAPKDWDAFFRSRASGTAKAAFDRLAIGPRQRTDRVARTLRNGESCDIYTAVLLAIARTGPLTELKYEEIRGGLRDILADAAPQAHEITRVLDQMARIAKEEIEGEPVVDWDKEYSTLHISDPFFAYYLRWGTQLP